MFQRPTSPFCALSHVSSLAGTRALCLFIWLEGISLKSARHFCDVVALREWSSLG